MKKVVISGSAKLQDKIEYWKNIFQNSRYEIIDYPKPIDKDKFMELYPNICQDFFVNITKADILFIMNEDKNNLKGYIGVATFAELAFGLAQKLVYKRNIELIILQMPDSKVQCYDEICLWLKLG